MDFKDMRLVTSDEIEMPYFNKHTLAKLEVPLAYVEGVQLGAEDSELGVTANEVAELLDTAITDPSSGLAIELLLHVLQAKSDQCEDERTKTFIGNVIDQVISHI